MDRLELIKHVSTMMQRRADAETIVDAVIDALTPEDGDECPVCGICP